MTHRKYTKIIAVFAIFCMLIPTVFAYEAEEENSPLLRFSQLCHFGTDFSISSNGSALCYSSAEVDTASYNITLDMQLQRSSNGRTWSTVRNWSSSGTGSALLDKIYYVSPGYDYRLHVTATVSNASGRILETATKDSSIVSY